MLELKLNERSALVAVLVLLVSCKINNLRRLNVAVEFKSTPRNVTGINQTKKTGRS